MCRAVQIFAAVLYERKSCGLGWSGVCAFFREMGAAECRERERGGVGSFVELGKLARVGGAFQAA